MPRRHRAVLRLIAGALLISLSPVWVKLTPLPPTVVAVYRLAVGGVILAAVVLLRRLPWPRPRRVWWLLLAAGAAFALDLFFWHRSILYVGAGLATLLANFQVFILTAAGWLLFAQRPSRVQTAAVVLAMAGLLLVLGSDWGALPAGYSRGVGLGILTALSYGVYLLAMQRARLLGESAQAVPDVAVASLCGALVLTVMAVLAGDRLYVPPGRDLLVLVAYGVFSQALGWVVISGALARLTPAAVGLLLLVQPVAAFLWDVLFFGRGVAPREAAGAVVALIAIYLGTRPRAPVAG